MDRTLLMNRKGLMNQKGLRAFVSLRRRASHLRSALARGALAASFAVLGAGGGLALPRQACKITEDQSLVPTGSQPLDRVGSSVALAGDRLVVSALLHDEAGPDFGAVYVYERHGGTWNEVAELWPCGGASLDYFGYSLDLTGDQLGARIVVGAPEADANPPIVVNSGRAYVYRRDPSGWVCEAVLDAPNPDTGDGFGTAVAIDATGDTLIVGAHGQNPLGSLSGSAYVFQRSGTSWSSVIELTAFPPGPPDNHAGEEFGLAVDIDGDRIAIGAPSPTFGTTQDGVVYTFEWSGAAWVNETKIPTPGASPTVFEWFGFAVALDGDRLLVGANNDDDGASSGAAYVFTRGAIGWDASPEAVLAAGDGRPGDQLGFSVALDGAAALVGAPFADITSADEGAAYLFFRFETPEGSRWRQVAQLTAATLGNPERAGLSVALDAETAVAGAHIEDAPTTPAGRALVYERLARTGLPYCFCTSGVAPCGNGDAAAGCANSTSSGGFLAAFGPTLPDDLNLVAQGAVPAQPAIFFQGDLATNGGMGLPFGDGLRCAGTNVSRLPPTGAVVIDLDGWACFGPRFGDPSISSITGVTPGSGVTKRYQFWYRDPLPSGCAPPATFNLSNGVEAIW